MTDIHVDARPWRPKFFPSKAKLQRIELEPKQKPVRRPDPVFAAEVVEAFYAPNLTVAQRIKRQIAIAYGVTVADIEGASRVTRCIVARQDAMAKVRAETQLSEPTIGHLFGGRDHATVRNSFRRHDEAIRSMAAKVALHLETRRLRK